MTPWTARTGATREARLAFPGLALVSILVVAAVLRVAALAWVGHSAGLHGDENYFMRAARSLAAENRYPDSMRPPGFPFFASLVFRLAGPSLDAVRVAQIVVSLIAIVLLFDLVRRRFGWRAASISALLTAVHPTLISYTHFLWSETLVATLLLAMLWSLDHVDVERGELWTASAGAALGATILTREMFLYAVPLVAWWVWSVPSHTARARAGRVAVLVLVVTAFIVPWSARNYARQGRFVLIATMRWLPIAEGNLLPQNGWFFYSNNEIASRYFTIGDELEREEVARRAAMEAIRAQQPAWIFRKIVRNTYRLFSPKWTQLSRFAYSGWFPPDVLPLAERLSALEFWFYAVHMVICLTAIWIVPGGRLKWMVGAIILFSVSVYIFANANHRFRVPLLPLFSMYVGPLLMGATSRNRRRLRVAGAATSVLLFLLIAATSVFIDPTTPN